MEVYLDNAATTRMDAAVFDVMAPFYREAFGNPSATHTRGRRARLEVEKARKTIAECLNAAPADIFFTSGGTEADNMAIHSAVRAHGVKRIISSHLEHHAVLNVLKDLSARELVEIVFLDHDSQGRVDLDQLESLLLIKGETLVTLMHANNEVATMHDISSIARLCHSYGALFHSDTVQTVGHYQMDMLDETSPDFIVGSAHKFHGPQGTGFLCRRPTIALSRFLHGGGQEMGLRAGTENVAGIVGMAKALEIACTNMKNHQQHILQLKKRLMKGIIEIFPSAQFNGTSGQETGLCSVLSVSMDILDDELPILAKLNIAGIYASGGSACTGGSKSHVINALGTGERKETIRFSFSRNNTSSEVDYVLSVMSAVGTVKV
ncbi:cysteine desulfurase family protein [Desertivirga arenae]|uniref:cysteine desulfurase family protein n=1 Tax=Desertivirga arenae TaxID=2810309 RepID=UPI001A96580F|nr:cysteine desulfurase family protein [Pedobacter sp. SYSU D00823]